MYPKGTQFTEFPINHISDLPNLLKSGRNVKNARGKINDCLRKRMIMYQLLYFWIILKTDQEKSPQSCVYDIYIQSQMDYKSALGPPT